MLPVGESRPNRLKANQNQNWNLQPVEGRAEPVGMRAEVCYRFGVKLNRLEIVQRPLEWVLPVGGDAQPVEGCSGKFRGLSG